MIPLVLLVLLAGSGVQETQPAESHARWVNRVNLPAELNLPFRENGFTVVAVTVLNHGSQALKIDTSQIRILDPKNKPIALASSSEITPKMVKSGWSPTLSAGAAGPPIYAPGYGGSRPRETGTTIGSSSSGGGGVVDIERVERLKATIEKYQLKSSDVQQGRKAEGYLYLKTDKDLDKLKGTRVVITEEITLTVE